MIDTSTLNTLVQRSMRHLSERTTDQSDATMELPVSEYLDEALWRREQEAIFLRRPLVLGYSAELREPGDYRALTIRKIPVLLVRGKDGIARAFINACRHRGTQLLADGCGHAMRFACPYHAWTYDAQGALVGIYQEKMFGDVDRSSRGLTQLSCVERAGIIWGILTPGIPLDIDAWLGSYSPVLETLQIGEWYVAERRSLPGPNWKVAFDGYMEGYHFNVLHRPSVGKDTKGTMLGDQFGPHQRLIFAREGLRECSDPASLPTVADAVFPVHIIYPNVSIAGGYHDQMLISQVLPGETMDASLTLMTILSRKPVENDDKQRERMRKYADYIQAVIRDEDYLAAERIQATLASGGNKTFLIGRNEYPLQTFHRFLKEHRDAELPRPG